MKKQFFYAAFALAMMASCTSEDTPLVEQPTTPEDDRVAIELGIDSPTITAAVSRGTGSVGDVAGSNNNWNKQRLYIAMINNNTDAGVVGNIAQEKVANTNTKQDILTWNNYEYRAPSSGESGTIRIYDFNTYGKTANVIGQDGSITTDNSDKGTLRYVYYPTQGTYDFYGWHVDAAAVTGTESSTNIPQNGTPTIAGGTATVTNITIDGTQDIMGARTKEFTYDNYKVNANGQTIDESTFNTLAEKPWNFSARTARNGIKPILKFEHQLARLKFFVRAGSAKTIKQWEKKISTDETTDGAMYIDSLSIPNLFNKLDMNLNATVNQKKVVTTAVADGATATNTFKLGSLINGMVTPGVLTATAPTKVYPDNSDASYKGTPVGESIMFFPSGTSETELEIDLALKQYVQLTKDEVDEDNNKFGFKYQDAKVTVKSSSIVGGTGTKKFEAGKSYNIYITIYGFERIEVTAELTAWADGGDVDVDIEEGESKDPVTPAKKTFTFNVTGNTGAATISINGQAIQGTTYEAAVGEDFTWSVTDGTTTKTGQVEVTAQSATTIDVDLTPAQAEKKTFTFNVTGNTTAATISINGQEIQGTTYEAAIGEDFTWSVTDGTTTKTGEVTVGAESVLTIDVDLTPAGN